MDNQIKADRSSTGILALV